MKKNLILRFQIQSYDNNKYLSAEIIRAGMGWHYKKYSKSIELAEIELEAQKEKRGLWIDNNPKSPSEWQNKID